MHASNRPSKHTYVRKRFVHGCAECRVRASAVSCAQWRACMIPARAAGTDQAAASPQEPPRARIGTPPPTTPETETPTAATATRTRRAKPLLLLLLSLFLLWQLQLPLVCRHCHRHHHHHLPAVGLPGRRRNRGGALQIGPDQTRLIAVSQKKIVKTGVVQCVWASAD
jgi:hypothetical protein